MIYKFKTDEPTDYIKYILPWQCNYKGNVDKSYKCLLSDNIWVEIEYSEIDIDLFFLNFADTDKLIGSKFNYSTRMKLMSADKHYFVIQNDYYLEIEKEEFEIIKDGCLKDVN